MSVHATSWSRLRPTPTRKRLEPDQPAARSDGPALLRGSGQRRSPRFANDTLDRIAPNRRRYQLLRDADHHRGPLRRRAGHAPIRQFEIGADELQAPGPEGVPMVPFVARGNRHRPFSRSSSERATGPPGRHGLQPAGRAANGRAVALPGSADGSDRQALAAFAAARAQHGATTAGLLADQEAMRSLATADGGLISALHDRTVAKRVGCRSTGRSAAEIEKSLLLHSIRANVSMQRRDCVLWIS